jgi:hypothetical protein
MTLSRKMNRSLNLLMLAILSGGSLAIFCLVYFY